MSIQAALILLALLTPCCQAPAQQPKDPPMPEPVAKFWQKLAKAKTLAVTVRKWNVADGQPGDSPRPLRLTNTSEIKIERPNLVSVHSSPPSVEQSPSADGSIIVKSSGGGTDYVSDGKTAIRLMPQFHAYGPAAPIDTLLQRRGNPLQSLFITWTFTEHPMMGMAPHANDRTPQPTVSGTIFVLKDARDDKNEEWYFFDPKTGNLTRMSNFYWDGKGHVFEALRYEYDFWEFDPKLPKSTFDPTPPKNWKPFPTRRAEPSNPPGA